MAIFTKGTVVLGLFPHTNASQPKIRPFYILQTNGFGDYTAIFITSQTKNYKNQLKLEESFFQSGNLKKESYLMIDKIMTVHSNVIRKAIGKLNNKAIDLIDDSVCNYIK